MSIKVIFTDGECMYDEKIKIYFGLVREIIDELQFKEILLNEFGVTRDRFESLVKTCDIMIHMDAYFKTDDSELFDYLDCIFSKSEKNVENISPFWCMEFAKRGQLNYLKYVHKKGCKITNYSLIEAIKNKHFECVKYICENQRCDENIAIKLVGEDSYVIFVVAAICGNLECLKYFHEIGFKFDFSACASAAKKGHIECLKYLIDNGCPYEQSDCPNILEYAIEGNVECIKYLHEKGCTWNGLTCNLAAKNGRSDILKYLHEKGYPWSKFTCNLAAENGNLDCLKYLHENGCPWDYETHIIASQRGHSKCFFYAMENGCPLTMDVH
jgi:hypothetical protein